MNQHITTEENSTTEDTGEDTVESNLEYQACDECGGDLREDEQHGEVICEDCGLIIDEKAIDRGPEWRAFDSGERESKSRVGAPTTNTLHDKGLSTNISWQDKDAYGNTLSASQRQKMQRLRTWNERFRTQDSKDRNLKQALGEISRMCSALGLNNQVEETAGVMYRRCLDENMLPGRSIEGMATACLYAAARQCNTPRSLDEIYPVCRVDNEKAIDRSYRYIASELGLEMEPVDPRQYLNRFINGLELDEPQAVRRTAEELLSIAERENIHSGKSPTGLAAAAIYAAGLLENEEITQRKVADVANSTEVTIRNRYQEMLAAADYPVSR